MHIFKGGPATGLALAIVLASCAAGVESVPVTFVPAPGGDMLLARSVDITLPTRYTRNLAEGSRWRRVGSVAQGEVFRPVNGVFTIEGRHVHEAYLVVGPQRTLVGFYLPGEAAVSILPTPIQLTTRENP